MKLRIRFVSALFSAILLAVFFGFAVKNNPDWKFKLQSLFGVAPCQRPLVYTIGSIDERFGLNNKNLLKILEEAKNVWEDSLSKNLFTYEQTNSKNSVKINLIYDYRQNTTKTLDSLSPKIDANKEAYEEKKVEYIALKTKYDRAKQELSALTANFEKEKAIYESKVSHWNSQGGAPKNEYKNLTDTQNNLQTLINEINNKTAELNKTSSLLNTMIEQLNILAKNVNADVSTYNNVSQKVGTTFDEGMYKYDETGASINIYQFSDVNELRRVLAHELGHALGLDHVNDPEAIIFYLNQSENLKPTQADTDEIKKVCRF